MATSGTGTTCGYTPSFSAPGRRPRSLPPLPIDRNDAALLNLFVDFKLADLDGHPAYIRGGRQELLFGSQRLISPLDWANTRRTFQGVRAFRQTEKWDFDLFWVQPVIPNVGKVDSVDNNLNFVGAWATVRPKAGQSIDAYYLMLDNTSTLTLLDIPRGNFTRHTFGGRYAGVEGNFLFDIEAAMQLGSQNGRDVVAGMSTVGAGYNFKDAPLTPTIWAYYDYASGGNPTSGTAHTFNQLFAFGHYYLGWVDQVGRQNIHDLNFHLYLYPAKWLTTWLQFHSFWLADDRDALYNAGGIPTRRDATGSAGSHVGEELDFVVNFHLTKHLDLLTVTPTSGVANTSATPPARRTLPTPACSSCRRVTAGDSGQGGCNGGPGGGGCPLVGEARQSHAVQPGPRRWVCTELNS